jgi:hypothetical protein
VGVFGYYAFNLAYSLFPALSDNGRTWFLYWMIGRPLYVFSLILVPVTFLIAVRRHHLWDIDLIINRTLVYGSLTASLGLCYVCTIFILQALLSPLTGTSNLVVAGSTLIVAFLARPFRNRIQRIIDRQFYRQRYDMARTLDAFVNGLRAEVDLDAVTDELQEVVLRTMLPAHVTLWLRDPRPSGPSKAASGH